MGKLNIKKVNYILFTVVISIGFYGCTMKQADNSEVLLASQVETVSTIKELSVQAQTIAQTTTLASADSSAIIKQYGSYEAFEKSILANLNTLRAQYGYGALTSEWHAEIIAQAVSEINASINNPRHIYAYEYPAVTGMYRNDELCIIGFQSELVDPSIVVEQLANYSTEKIISDSDNIYVGIGLKAYGDKIAIVIDAYSKSDFNSYIIGNQKILELGPSGDQYLNKSIWNVN